MIKSAVIGSKNLVTGGMRKGVEAGAEASLKAIGGITKWTLSRIFNLLVKMPLKAAGKAALSAHVLPGPK